MRFSIWSGVLACVAIAAASSDAHKECSPKVISLATGIRMNIVGQMAELNATESLLKLENQTPFSQSLFDIGKGKLLADIAAGINIRTYNLAIAPPNNPARPGLHKYANAQGMEQALAMELNGNATHDLPKLHMLKSDIMGGIKLNMRNLAASTSKHNCKLGFKFPPYP